MQPGCRLRSAFHVTAAFRTGRKSSPAPLPSYICMYCMYAVYNCFTPLPSPCCDKPCSASCNQTRSFGLSARYLAGLCGGAAGPPKHSRLYQTPTPSSSRTEASHDGPSRATRARLCSICQAMTNVPIYVCNPTGDGSGEGGNVSAGISHYDSGLRVTGLSQPILAPTLPSILTYLCTYAQSDRQ